MSSCFLAEVIIHGSVCVCVCSNELSGPADSSLSAEQLQEETPEQLDQQEAPEPPAAPAKQHLPTGKVI